MALVAVTAAEEAEAERELAVSLESAPFVLRRHALHTADHITATEHIARRIRAAALRALAALAAPALFILMLIARQPVACISAMAQPAALFRAEAET
jgi:hypothetical protein